MLPEPSPVLQFIATWVVFPLAVANGIDVVVPYVCTWLAEQWRRITRAGEATLRRAHRLLAVTSHWRPKTPRGGNQIVPTLSTGPATSPIYHKREIGDRVSPCGSARMSKFSAGRKGTMARKHSTNSGVGQ
jgi:hypothetical protein